MSLVVLPLVAWQPLLAGAVLAVGGAGAGLLSTLGPALASLSVRPGEEGDAIAAQGTFRAVAQFVAPVGVGATIAAFALPVTFAISAAVLCLPLVVARAAHEHGDCIASRDAPARPRRGSTPCRARA